jgi:hypothetical protein
MLIDTRDPSPADRARPPWQPNWRVVAWAAAAIVIGIGGASADDAIGVVLIMVAFAAGCRALDEALPYKEGLREHRQ